MLSVLFSTSGLHDSRWQSGGICQVLSIGAFTLFCHDVHSFTEDFLSFFVTLVIVLMRLSSRCLPFSWPGAASIRSCLWLPLGFLDTREAGNCARSRACVLFQSYRLVSARDDMCPVVSGGLRERSLHVMLKFEGPASLNYCFHYFVSLILH